MRFTKMHGIGNDYIYVNCFEENVPNPSDMAIKVSNRNTGVGSDGLILIHPSEKADIRMQMFNADGSEAEMCGNGIRCLAKYVYEHKLSKPGKEFNIPGQLPIPASLTIETGSGVLTVGLHINEKNLVDKVTVNMSVPILDPKKIPVNHKGDRIIDEPVNILDQQLLMTCVSMGNPHAVFFCDDVATVELEKLGPAIENHNLFPNRTNVHFVQIDKPDEFTMRTWERGSGITLACGTGACACCVAAILTKQCQRICTAHLPGGDLELNWNEQDNCVYMTGSAIKIFDGIWSEE